MQQAWDVTVTVHNLDSTGSQFTAAAQNSMMLGEPVAIPYNNAKPCQCCAPLHARQEQEYCNDKNQIMAGLPPAVSGTSCEALQSVHAGLTPNQSLVV
jgi:hypothetical protein